MRAPASGGKGPGSELSATTPSLRPLLPGLAVALLQMGRLGSGEGLRLPPPRTAAFLGYPSREGSRDRA